MPLAQGLRPEAEPPGSPRGEVLDEDVSPLDEALQDLPRTLFFQIEGNGLLCAVEPDEVARETPGGPVVGAGEVPGTRTLDLYDPRAEVGELAGGEGSRDRLLQGDDGNAFERQHF